MEIVLSLIDMSVGVAEGKTGVNGTSVDVGGMGVKVDGEETAVGKTSIEKVQALSNNALNTKTIINSNH